jgi:hypothetical protein
MKKHTFFYRNGLSVVFLGLFLVTLGLQAYTGWCDYNDELLEKGSHEISLGEYLGSGRFIQLTFENWESEFFQMGLYVLLTVFLRQKGSAESKSLTEREPVDRQPKAHKNAPWAVRRGGVFLAIYRNSLSIAFFILFLVSFVLHAWGSLKDHNLDRQLMGKHAESMGEYLTQPRFWMESFQNWQSEFLAVASIVILSIFLRQYGSPESKPVDAPDSETGK